MANENPWADAEIQDTEVQGSYPEEKGRRPTSCRLPKVSVCETKDERTTYHWQKARKCDASWSSFGFWYVS
jgi:hypothetical protein